MRLTSSSFTHGSTAVFGLAVACYAAVRIAGYDLPHDPVRQALAGPSIAHRVPDTGLSARPSPDQKPRADRVTHVVDTDRPTRDDAAERATSHAQPADPDGTSQDRSRATDSESEDAPRVEDDHTSSGDDGHDDSSGSGSGDGTTSDDDGHHDEEPEEA